MRIKQRKINIEQRMKLKHNIDGPVQLPQFVNDFSIKGLHSLARTFPFDIIRGEAP